MTKTVSIRLPSNLAAKFKGDVAGDKMSLSSTFDLMLRLSFNEGEAICALDDCPDALDTKIDVRVPLQTLESVKSICRQHGIPIGAYIRQLLYNFYSTRRVRLVGEGNRYKLAVHHDEV